MTDLKTFLKTTPLYLKLLGNNWINTVKDFFNYFVKDFPFKSRKESFCWFQYDELFFNAT